MGNHDVFINFAYTKVRTGIGFTHPELAEVLFFGSLCIFKLDQSLKIETLGGGKLKSSHKLRNVLK